MTFSRGEANRPVLDNVHEFGISVREYARTLRAPVRVPQVADPFNYDQREIDHTMRCRKVGCTRCSA